MPTRTIKDAGGNWSASGTWVEAAVPTAADEVVATATSGNLTIDVAAACRSIDLTGYVGTLTHNAGVTLTIGDATSPTGNNALVFPSSGWTYTLDSATTSKITFASTSATVLNINPGGKTFGNVDFNGTGGSYRLTGDLLTGTSSSVRVRRGTFDANGYNVTVGLLDDSSSVATRAITMGSGTWTITGNNATVLYLFATGLTFTRGTNPFVLNYSGSTGTRNIRNNLAEASAPDVTITAGTDIVTQHLATSNRNLVFDGFTGTWTIQLTGTHYGNVTIAAASASMTVGGLSSMMTFAATSGTQTLTSAGKTFCNITMNGVGGTLQLADHLTIDPARTLTLTNGTLDFNNKNVSAGVFASSNSNVRVLNMGSGTLTLHRTSTVTIWNTATATNLTINRGTCAVVIANGAAASVRTLNGSPTFHSLSCQATVAQTLTFTDGTTTTVSNSLTLTGASGQLLTLQGSGSAGWTIAVPATQTLAYLSVSRSTATGNTAAAGSTSTDGGNNVNWTFGASSGNLGGVAMRGRHRVFMRR